MNSSRAPLPIFVGMDSNYNEEIIRICRQKFNIKGPVVFIKNPDLLNSHRFISTHNAHIYLGIGNNYKDLLEDLYIFRFLNRFRFKSKDININDFLFFNDDYEYLTCLKNNIVLESFQSYCVYVKLLRKTGEEFLAIDTLVSMKENFPKNLKIIQRLVINHINYDLDKKFELLAYYLRNNTKSLKIEINKSMSSGNYDAAIILLQQFLKSNPSDYSELKKLGVAYYKSYDNVNALRYLKTARSINQDHSVEYLIGIVKYNMMNFDDAINYIERAISLHPANLSLYKTLNALKSNNQKIVFDKEFYKYLQSKTGLPSIKNIVELVNYKYMLSVCYLANGNKDKYIELNYHIINFLRPDFYNSYKAIIELSDNDEKAKIVNSIDKWIHLLKIIKFYDKYFDNNNRITKYYQSLLLLKARVLILIGKKEEAEKFFYESYKSLKHHKALKWLGYYNLWAQNYDQAIEFYIKYLEIKPKDVEAKLNLARTYLELGKYKSAEEIVKSNYKVLTNAANIDKSHLVRRNLAYAKGDLSRAWDIFSERNINRSLKNNPIIKYNSNLNNFQPPKSTLILTEWGPGDEIRWASIYEDLSKIFSDLSITCEPRLYSLFNRTWSNINFIPVNRRIRGVVNHEQLSIINNVPNTLLTQVIDNNLYCDIENFDQVSLISDALKFVRSDFSDFTSSYNKSPINICSIRSSIWKDWLNKLDNNINIGVCWKSGLTNFTRNIHYTEIEMWREVFQIKGVNFINLQYANFEEDIEFVETNYGVTLHNPKGLDLKNDFESLAALMTNLDLVISPATTIAEFAGLLNVKTLLTSNSREIDWRIDSSQRDLWFSSIYHITADRNISNIDAQKSIIRKVRSYLEDFIHEFNN